MARKKIVITIDPDRLLQDFINKFPSVTKDKIGDAFLTYTTNAMKMAFCTASANPDKGGVWWWGLKGTIHSSFLTVKNTGLPKVEEEEDDHYSCTN